MVRVKPVVYDKDGKQINLELFLEDGTLNPNVAEVDKETGALTRFTWASGAKVAEVTPAERNLSEVPANATEVVLLSLKKENEELKGMMAEILAELKAKKEAKWFS